jgi:hypothetical protein
MSKERMLKKGDKVVMHTCGESAFPKYYGKVWTCKTDEYITGEGKGLYEQRLVFLEGFSGSFATDYLQYIDLEEMQKALEWYADPKNYRHVESAAYSDVALDEGETARDALKGVETK